MLPYGHVFLFLLGIQTYLARSDYFHISFTDSVILYISSGQTLDANESSSIINTAINENHKLGNRVIIMTYALLVEGRSLYYLTLQFYEHLTKLQCLFPSKITLHVFNLKFSYNVLFLCANIILTIHLLVFLGVCRITSYLLLKLCCSISRLLHSLSVIFSSCFFKM